MFARPAYKLAIDQWKKDNREAAAAARRTAKRREEEEAGSSKPAAAPRSSAGAGTAARFLLLPTREGCPPDRPRSPPPCSGPRRSSGRPPPKWRPLRTMSNKPRLPSSRSIASSPAAAALSCTASRGRLRFSRRRRGNSGRRRRLRPLLPVRRRWCRRPLQSSWAGGPRRVGTAGRRLCCMPGRTAGCRWPRGLQRPGCRRVWSTRRRCRGWLRGYGQQEGAFRSTWILCRLISGLTEVGAAR